MKQKPPSIVPVLVLTLLTAVTWVIFSIYTALTSKPETVVSSEIAEPFDATLDKTVIEKIKGRLFLDDSQIPTTTFNSTLPGASPSSSPSASPIATPSSEAESTTPATESGTLSQ